MPIPEYPEPGANPGHKEIPQQRSINFSTAIPLKKRRFPIFHENFLSPEEKSSPPEGKQDLKDKQDHKVTDGGLPLNVASPPNLDLGKTSLVAVKKEVTPTSTSLGPLDDLGNKKDILHSGNSSESGKTMQELVSGKTEGAHRLEISVRKMNVELSLGTKEPLVSAMKHRNSGSVIIKSETSNTSLLSLGLQEEKLVLNNDSNRVCANRSNWDLNTTMDVWESSTISDAFAHRVLDGLNKTNSCQDEKSSLTTEGKIGLPSGKGKSTLDGKASSFSNVSTKSTQQSKTEDSLRLVIASPSLNTISENPSSSNNLITVDPCMSSKQAQVSISKVKPEPVDENSKPACSVGSSSSSSMELLKISSVKRELLSTPSLKSILQSTISPEKLAESRSLMPGVVQDHNEEASKSDDAAVQQSARKVIQHQDSCSSSSSLPLSLMHPNPTSSRLPTCLELTTSGDLSKQSAQPSLSKVENLSVVDPDKDDKHNNELSENMVAAYDDDDDDMDISPERHEENTKGDEEYEDGEVREPIQLLAHESSIPEEMKTERLELVAPDSQNINMSDMPDIEGKDAVMKTQEETHSYPDKDCLEPSIDDDSFPITFDKAVIDEKVFTPDKTLDFSGNHVRESPGKEVLVDVRCNGSPDGNCLVENDLSLSKVEAPLDGNDTVKDNSAGNKSRIINLARASFVTAPLKTKSIPSRLVTRSGKEKYSDLDGEWQPRRNRDEFYTGGSNKFVKGRVHDPSHRNSRPNFMFGKGRGRFGSLRGDWDSKHEFSSETSYGPSDYHVIRRKHNSSTSDIDLDCNEYGVQLDGRNRRKTMNDGFPTLRRTSLRRISSGDRDGPVPTRGAQMLHRIPRNLSPRRLSTEGGPDAIGLRHDDKFMRVSDDIGDPVYNCPQTMYDELDDQLVQRERNFSTMQRKNYPRIRSKSPVRSRTRSPGPWSSPQRRSPNGLQELNQHRSPPLFRMRRLRSPDRACFRDEMVSRRRGSPSFVTRHNNDMRDVDSGREHVHPRPPVESNRRSSPGRVFQRNARRNDALDNRELGDGDEYMNGPNIDERRKLFERHGPIRPFRPNYNGENENFQFHMNDGGPRPYRFITDAEAEFVERGNMREREFDGRMKQHQPNLVRRIRNMEEQQEGNFRPIERGVWHEDGGFPDGRVKRRRF